MSSANIDKEIATGSVWMLLMRLSVKGIGIISTLVLARLLMPEDFGLVALAMTVLAFIELIRVMGVDSALIQNQNATSEHYNTAWTMQVILGVITAILLLVASVWAPGYFKEQKLTNIFYALSALSIITGFTNIGIVDFRKRMIFKSEFRFQVFPKFLGVFVTISAAFLLKNYWALVIGQLFQEILKTIISYRMSPFRPKLTIVLWREIYNFSVWLQINNVFFFINNRVQFFFLGKFGTTTDVGNYNLANEIATITTTEIVAPINRAAFPGYAKIAKEYEKLKNTYLNVLSLIALVSIPSATGIFLVAPDLVSVALGDKWLDTIPLIKIIALSSIFSALSTNTGYIYLVVAKQKITTFIMVLRSVIFIFLLFYLIPGHGPIGAALATFVTNLVIFPVTQYISAKIIGLKFAQWVYSLYRPAFSAVIMALGLSQLKNLNIITDLDDLARLFLLSNIGAFIFIFVDITLALQNKKQSVEVKLLSSARSKIKSWKMWYG